MIDHRVNKNKIVFWLSGSVGFCKRTVLNLTLALGSCFIIWVFVELGLHLFFPIQYMKPATPSRNDVWRRMLHQRAYVPGLAYELAPHRVYFSRGALIHTNSYGMRDDEPQPRSDPVHRIVVIGDSFTFGFGISGSETYGNQLERFLNEGYANKEFEVLNLGVGGYSSKDEVSSLYYKGIKWNPELIVLGYTLNDPEIDPIQPLYQYFHEPKWWQYSQVLRLFALSKRQVDILRLGNGDYFRYLHEHPEKWSSVVESFRKIGSISKNKEIPVLVVIFPMIREEHGKYPYRDLHRKVAHAAIQNDLQVLDLYDVFSNYAPSEVILGPPDPHPSEFGHQLAAKAIFDWMIQIRTYSLVTQMNDWKKRNAEG